MVVVYSKEDWPVIVAGNKLVISSGRNEVPEDLWDLVKSRKRVQARISSGRWVVSEPSVSEAPKKKGPKKIPKASKVEPLPEEW